MLNKMLVKNTVEAETKYIAANPRLKNKLIDDPIPLFLQINSIKVPKGYSKIVRIPLKNTKLLPETEICLIVPDVKGIRNNEHEKHLNFYEELLKKKSVRNIKKIMTFHEFRTEYDTFELKKRLVELYDVFLVDGRIGGKVVRKCGKLFYKKRKVPVSIKMQASKLKEHIEQALMKTPLFIHPNGDSFCVEFGHSKMDLEKLTENVFSVVECLDKEFPGGFANVRSINVFANGGLTIPLYTTLKNQNEVPEVKISSREKEELESFKKILY